MSESVLPTAEVVPFTPRRRDDGPGRGRPLSPGDVVVACVNDALGLWCAWPVALVDDDGVAVAVETSGGRVIGVDRVNCRPDVYGLAARDHEPEGFAALRWKTWRDPDAALTAFAAAGTRR